MTQDVFPAHPEAVQISALYRQYAPALLVSLRRQAASWEDAEDLLVEVFLAVLEEPQVLAVPEHQRLFWLRGVAQRRLVDYYRRNHRRPTRTVAELSERFLADEALEPEQVVLLQEDHAQVRQAVEHLPAAYQEVLQLRFGHNLRCTEIGTLLDKQEGAVRALLWRALKLLRTRYEELARGGPRHDRTR